MIEDQEDYDIYEDLRQYRQWQETDDRRMRAALLKFIAFIALATFVILALVDCGGSASQANATPNATKVITISVLHVRGPEALPQAIAKSNANEIVKHLKADIGLTAKVRSFKSISNPFPKGQFGLSQDSRIQMLWNWESWIEKHGQCHSDVCLIIIPPFISTDASDAGQWY